ncbi:unnamed protein product, partial [Closterium sp. Yama58-4]
TWADAVAAGRRKRLEHPAALSPLGSGSASALVSPCGGGGGGSPAWRPAALAAVRSPLAPVVRHRATASVDMEELWAEEASDETSGAARRPRRNRIIIRRARNASSDFPSLRSALGDEKPPGSADGGSGRRAATGWVPTAPPWEGEAPDSAEGSDAARPSIISRRPGATAIRKLRIFSNRGRDSTSVAAFAAPAGSAASSPGTDAAAASAAAGNGAAPGEGLEGVSAPSRTRGGRLMVKSAGGGGTVLKTSPQGQRGRAGVAVRRRRSFSEYEADPAATVVPFVRREEDEQRESQRPSQESSQPSHIMRSLDSGEGRQEAAGQENADALRAPPRSDKASEMTKRSGETGGEESKWRNGGQLRAASYHEGTSGPRSSETAGEQSRGQQRAASYHEERRAASYHEELASDLVDYFGEIAQSWSIECSGRTCDSVEHPREAEAGEIAQSWNTARERSRCTFESNVTFCVDAEGTVFDSSSGGHQ